MFLYCSFKSWLSSASASFLTHAPLFPVACARRHTHRPTWLLELLSVFSQPRSFQKMTLSKWLFLFNAVECYTLPGGFQIQWVLRVNVSGLPTGGLLEDEPAALGEGDHVAPSALGSLEVGNDSLPGGEGAELWRAFPLVRTSLVFLVQPQPAPHAHPNSHSSGTQTLAAFSSSWDPVFPLRHATPPAPAPCGCPATSRFQVS